MRRPTATFVTASPPSAPPAAGPGAAEPLLSAPLLQRLNERRDGPGWRRLTFHLAVLGLGALLWGWPWPQALPGAGFWALRLTGLLLLGWGLAFGFCAMHECGHRTAFAGKGLNDTVAWWAGLLSFYNADYYRRYHQWHHRFTHQPGLDPELEEAPPSTLAAYLLELSGIPWWIGKLRGHTAGLRGDFGGRPYIPAEAAAAVTRSIRLQVAVYAALLAASFWQGNGALFWYWLLPLAVGQPLLRFVLMAEHGGCSTDSNGLSNTRTTRTLPPLRWLMWEMPFHVEHHLYPSVPFHALAEAHRHLAPHEVHTGQGYLSVHRDFLRDPARLALP
ncbi:fatty acid desaturase [Aphanothece minutissima]|uniref:fatty acid desaturase n=1 Tax=Aphanothece minutissima TaxID=543815 RepID=UPI0015E77A73|nr:fatty acid desaturase [Aphanothece minutissima]